MDSRLLQGRAVASLFLVALTGVVLAGFAAATHALAEDPPSFVVPKATCGPNDHPETALQGQVPAALRSGFQGFSCNLELVGQDKIDGANWQTAEFRDPKGHDRDDGRGDRDRDGRGDRDRDGGGDRDRDDIVCAYHGSASPARSLPGRNPATFGVPVIDVTNPSNPITKGFLQTTSMLDPWESLKVNERRQLLGADNGQNGGGGPEVDIYDLSQDCRFPQLLASLPVGTGTDGSGIVHPIIGHEGTWAPDGLTYYGGDLRFKPAAPIASTGQYYAVDTSDPTRPKLITTWTTGIAGGNVHGMSISRDGRRGYFVSIGGLSGNPVAALTDPTIPANNGLLIYDLSQIQARVPNPQVKLISQLLWKDGSVSQHTIPIKIDGKPYLIFVDEGGSGGLSSTTQATAACAAGFPPFPMARIIDISDETHPKIVSRLGLETHDPANCAQVLPDIVGLSIFTYGSHYCSVDNKQNATTLACGYFNSGIRVFDIRHPKHPSEIAYFNPAGTTVASPGSNHVGQWHAGSPDWCSAQVHLNADNGTLWSTCQDNGLLVLKFTHGVWPFPETKTPPGGGEDD